MMESINNVINSTVYSGSYLQGKFALITESDIIRDIYHNYTANKATVLIGVNQPYPCEQWNSTFILNDPNPTFTIGAIVPSPRKLIMGTLPLSAAARYGQRCKWTYVPKLMTRKGGRRMAKGKYKHTRRR